MYSYITNTALRQQQVQYNVEEKGQVMRERIGICKILITASLSAALILGLPLAGCARYFQPGDNSEAGSAAEAQTVAQRAAVVNEAKTARFYSFAHSDLSMLTAFLQQMPKGASLQAGGTARNVALANLSTAAADSEVAAACTPLINQAFQERISYLEIATVLSPERLEAVVAALNSVHDEFLDNGVDWQLALDFVYPLNASLIVESPQVFEQAFNAALAAYQAEDSLYAAIALVLPDGARLTPIQTTALFDCIDTAWQAAQKVSEEQAAEEKDIEEKAATRSLCFIYPDAHWMTTNGKGASSLHGLSDLLDKGHASRVSGLSSIFTQEDSLAFVDKLKKQDVSVLLQLPAVSATPLLTSPFVTLRSAGVKVALGEVAQMQTSAQTAGKSAPALSEQFLAAAWSYDLSYPDLKALAYASLAAAYLDSDAASKVKANLDDAFFTFEAKMAERADAYSLK